jgi:hypothetical protein
MEISLAGRVANLSGGCPNWRFTIDSLRAWTWEKTSYERGPCSRMREGIEVELRGWLMSDGTLRVDQIRFDNDDGN